MLRRYTAAPRFMAAASLRHLHTPPEKRAVRVENLMAAPGVSYPTIYNGLFYRINIFDRVWWSVDSQKAVQAMVWNNECFLPTKPAQGLAGTPFEPISRIAAFQAAKHRSGREGLVAKNELRKTVWREIVDKEGERKMFDAFIDHLTAFQEKPTLEGAQLISNVAFWSQWLIRGILFEGKLHGEQYCSAHIPAPVSQIAFAANAALGRHQIEFVYDDYTLKAANFPTDRHFESVNYDDPQDVLRYVADIWTPVGFCDIDGHHPEHNFRHNHSLMEQQMRRAIKGWLHIRTKQSTGQDIINGWRDVAIAAERAHKVFNTMMGGTPADTYPLVRLPIKGVRGGAGNVYAPHGVFYEGCGTDVYEGMQGCYVDREFGQTGANSSMYKWFDILIGVTKQRGAYKLDDAQREKMLRVLSGHEDPGDMGVNPIDSMQRAFDLLTRPPLHLDFLVSTSDQVDRIPTILDVRSDPRLASNWELAAFERFKVAFFVASHRNVHGLYVLKMIYQTTPVGGQSRAEGTGGSTPPFLKMFFDQTFSPAMSISDELLQHGRPEVLGEANLKAVHAMRAQLNSEMEQMAKVQAKGLELERQEKEKNGSAGGAAAASGCPFSGKAAAAPHH